MSYGPDNFEQARTMQFAQSPQIASRELGMPAPTPGIVIKRRRITKYAPIFHVVDATDGLSILDPVDIALQRHRKFYKATVTIAYSAFAGSCSELFSPPPTPPTGEWDNDAGAIEIVAEQIPGSLNPVNTSALKLRGNIQRDFFAGPWPDEPNYIGVWIENIKFNVASSGSAMFPPWHWSDAGGWDIYNPYGTYSFNQVSAETTLLRWEQVLDHSKNEDIQFAWGGYHLVHSGTTTSSLQISDEFDWAAEITECKTRMAAFTWGEIWNDEWGYYGVDISYDEWRKGAELSQFYALSHGDNPESDRWAISEYSQVDLDDAGASQDATGAEESSDYAGPDGGISGFTVESVLNWAFLMLEQAQFKITGVDYAQYCVIEMAQPYTPLVADPLFGAPKTPAIVHVESAWAHKNEIVAVPDGSLPQFGDLSWEDGYGEHRILATGGKVQVIFGMTATEWFAANAASYVKVSGWNTEAPNPSRSPAKAKADTDPIWIDEDDTTIDPV